MSSVYLEEKDKPEAHCHILASICVIAHIDLYTQKGWSVRDNCRVRENCSENKTNSKVFGAVYLLIRSTVNVWTVYLMFFFGYLDSSGIQRSICLCPLSAVIKGMCCYSQLNFFQLNIYLHICGLCRCFAHTFICVLPLEARRAIIPGSGVHHVSAGTPTRVLWPLSYLCSSTLELNIGKYVRTN